MDEVGEFEEERPEELESIDEAEILEDELPEEVESFDEVGEFEEERSEELESIDEAEILEDELPEEVESFDEVGESEEEQSEELENRDESEILEDWLPEEVESFDEAEEFEEEQPEELENRDESEILEDWLPEEVESFDEAEEFEEEQLEELENRDESEILEEELPEGVESFDEAKEFEEEQTEELESIDEPETLREELPEEVENFEESEISDAEIEEFEDLDQPENSEISKDEYLDYENKIDQCDDIESLKALREQLTNQSPEESVNDYSYHWDGYEQHEFPEVENPKSLVKNGMSEFESSEDEQAQFDLEQAEWDIEDLYEDFTSHQIRELAQKRRAYNSPKDGEKGNWDGDRFVMNNDYIPEMYNPDNKTMGEIKDELNEKYNIDVAGIDYSDGEADFSKIAVANIDRDEIASQRENMSLEDWNKYTESEKLERSADIFQDRVKNFNIADQLASEKHIDIPVLGADYRADELARWRKENKFTWDEQVGKGYNLVPSAIHGNLSHTGLVSNMKNANEFYKEYKDNIDSESWPEGEDVPITYDELKKYKEKNKK